MGAARDHDESDEEPVGAGIGSICADGGELCAVDEPGGRRTGVSRIGAAEGERAAEDSFGTATDGRELSVSVAEACLRAGGQGEQRGIPTAVQLPLRPVAGAHEPAELF